MEWSPDQSLLAGLVEVEGDTAGIAVYSIETQQYLKITVSDGHHQGAGRKVNARPLWLNDSRRLLLQKGEILRLTDIDSQSAQKVLSVSPDTFSHRPSISVDNRTIYFTRLRTEADIWLLTLNEERNSIFLPQATQQSKMRLLFVRQLMENPFASPGLHC